MESSEELRETLVAMRREIDGLRVEATHANRLLMALDALLCVEDTNDVFASVFLALHPVFRFPMRWYSSVATTTRTPCNASSRIIPRWSTRSGW